MADQPIIQFIIIEDPPDEEMFVDVHGVILEDREDEIIGLVPRQDVLKIGAGENEEGDDVIQIMLPFSVLMSMAHAASQECTCDECDLVEEALSPLVKFPELEEDDEESEEEEDDWTLPATDHA